MSERAVDEALALAYRHLGRRDRTVAELRAHLARKGVEDGVAEAVVAELCEQGYLGDARYATRFAEDRRTLDGWGAERIAQRLRGLGVAADQVAAAVAEQDPAEELDAALSLLRRRVPEVPRTPRERDRALGLLVRKGYGLELAHDALRRYAGADEPFD